MQELKQEKSKDFMIETIKKRPLNKRKLARRTLITAVMAVIFGLIACFTFLTLEPVIGKWLYPEEKPGIVVFPEDPEEMSPEEMLAGNMEQEQQQLQEQVQEQVQEQLQEQLEEQQQLQENMSQVQEQVQEILSQVSFDMENYRQQYKALSSYVEELNRSMVTVTGVVSNMDWFNDIQESEYQASGVIIANNGRDLLILTDYAPLSKAESVHLTFFNKQSAEARILSYDGGTGLAVVGVRLTELNQEFLEEGLMIAPLGTTNIDNLIGKPVVAMGRPMGTDNSVGYGIVTSVTMSQTDPDFNYKILQTDITGSKNAGGVLFDLEGYIIGIITNTRAGSDMTNMVTAFGISDLKKRVEKMSNMEKIPYLGICGVDVPWKIHQELGVPKGAYVTKVEMDSPAMRAGIQTGDVVISLDGEPVTAFSEYTSKLVRRKAGAAVEIVLMRQVQDEYRQMEFKLTFGIVE